MEVTVKSKDAVRSEEERRPRIWVYDRRVYDRYDRRLADALIALHALRDEYHILDDRLDRLVDALVPPPEPRKEDAA
jgi:hypothetical protein